MTLEQKHKDKVITYIILGIIAVILIAFYVYTQLVAMSVQQEASVGQQYNTSAQSVELSAVQAAAKTMVINEVASQKPTPLSKSQAAAKAAAIAAFEKNNSGK